MSDHANLPNPPSYSLSYSLPYILHMKIFSGSSSDVYLGYEVPKSDVVAHQGDAKKKPYAIKVLNLDSLPDITTLQSEISTLRQCADSDHLVRYVARARVKISRFCAAVCLVSK